jgi:sigma-B regulation protein RsbU (phosphoserine phosphatase)
MSALASGQPLRFSMRRGTEVVGQVNATLSRTRLIETVLSLARRDRGEVPFVVEADGQIETTGAEAASLLAAMHFDTSGLAADGSPLTQTLGDYIVVMRRDPSGIAFGIARPIGDSLREMRRASLTNLGLGALLIACAFVVIVPLASRLTRDLGRLTDGVRRLDGGDRSARVFVDSKDEVGELARAFNQMAGDLASHEKMLVQQERLRRELELCRQIQNEMLPHGRLKLGLTEVSGVSIPATEVGGDFFNYFVLPDGSLALLVGDVSGKGVGAALLMANIQATLRAKLPLQASLPSLVDTVDRDIAANTPLEVYVTLFVGILDPTRLVLRYVNAGHNPQYVLRADGGIETLASTGLPVGLLPGRGYEERTLAVGSGDLLFLYTDGVVEVQNEADEMFGAERLQQLLRSHATAGVDDMLACVESGLRDFRGAAEPFDDATMMAMRLGAL